MSMVTIQSPDGTRRECVDELDFANGDEWLGDESMPNPYAGWLKIADGSPPDNEAQVVDGQWVVPLEVLQARLWSAVKARRGAIEEGTAPTPLGRVQIDEKSKLKISGLVTMAMLAQGQGQPFSEDFTMADNSVVTLDAASAIAMGVAAGQFVSAAYERARALRSEIDAAADAAALDAIDVEGGWPE